MKFTKLTIIAMAFSLGLLFNCASTEQAPPAPVVQTVSGKGKVVALKEGGFAIELDGKTFKPSNLDKKFQKKDAKIEFSGNVSGDSIELTSQK
jgi:hypothetical protein